MCKNNCTWTVQAWIVATAFLIIYQFRLVIESQGPTYYAV